LYLLVAVALTQEMLAAVVLVDTELGHHLLFLLLLL
jgi:hypothetical protein